MLSRRWRSSGLCPCCEKVFGLVPLYFVIPLPSSGFSLLHAEAGMIEEKKEREGRGEVRVTDEFGGRGWGVCGEVRKKQLSGVKVREDGAGSMKGNGGCYMSTCSLSPSRTHVFSRYCDNWDIFLKMV